MQQSDRHQRQRSPYDTSETSDEIQNMHDIFSDPYRCAVLYCLQLSEEPATVSEIANRVVTWSPDGDSIAAEDSDLRTWLLHTHILHLDEFGIVTYDSGRDVVRLSEDVSISVTSPWQED